MKVLLAINYGYNEAEFDLTNCGYGSNILNVSFMLARLLRKSFIFIYIMKMITVNQQTIHFNLG